MCPGRFVSCCLLLTACCLLPTAFLFRPVNQRIENHFERSVCLCPVLRPEADEHKLPVTTLRRDPGRLSGDDLLTEQPPTLKDFPVRERDDRIDLLVAVGRDNLIG